MKKTVAISFLMMLLFPYWGYSQDTIITPKYSPLGEMINNMPFYGNSYESRLKPFRFNNEILRHIDVKNILDISPQSYKDLGGQQKILWSLKHNECMVDVRFRFTQVSPYEILLLEIGQSNYRRSVLAPRTIAEGVIDTLEVERFFYFGGDGMRFLTKEFSLDSTLNVTVWEYESLEKEPIEFQMRGIDSYHARRIDSHYQIDPQTGKYRLHKRRYYKPRHYPQTYIQDGDKRIKNGGEELEREENIPVAQ